MLHHKSCLCYLSIYVLLCLPVGCSEKPHYRIPSPDVAIVGLAEQVKLTKIIGGPEHIEVWEPSSLCYIEGIVTCPQHLGEGRGLFVKTSYHHKGRWIGDGSWLNMDIEDLGNNKYKITKGFILPKLTGPHKATIQFNSKVLTEIHFTIDDSKQ